MASQSVMSTPIFDELLREMSASAAAEEPAEDTAEPAGQQTEASGRRRHRSS
ncbi:hypothetical protein [Actinokineospora iranica]|uniref:Uncharacterized protein n=1 Tax=Actinokineospora iranica TaxID=1271860 RepID=A0A1G6JJZ3_9PSEU|nr:hypothetical protein [Actinokineospora iranica]SDC19001.1 hypothetical protein SAMN05216174_101441 [Actinokineospora iranica]